MSDTFLTIGSKGEVLRKSPLASSAGDADGGKIVSTNEHGKLDSSLLPTDVVETIRDVIASEAIAANSFVNIYWNETDEAWNARNADAKDESKAAVGFVIAAVSNGSTARVYLSGELTLTGFSNAVTELHLAEEGAAAVFNLTYALTNEWKLLQLVARRTGANSFVFVQSEAVNL
jgi:hypothetical protein